MTTTSATTAPHEFSKCADLYCAICANGEPHRASGAPAESVDWLRICPDCSDTQLATDTPDASGAAVPERIFIQGEKWFDRPVAAGNGVEYILKSTHNAEVARLREALRRVGRFKDEVGTRERVLCWCKSSHVCTNEPQCVAARAAIK